MGDGVLNLQPRLTGQLVELRPLSVDDFDALFQAASDPLIWAQHPEPDRYTPEVFQRYFDSAIDSKGAFAIVDRGSGRVIGSSRYANLSTEPSEVEIGWTFLERAYWGGAYNREVKTLMLDHAFHFVDRVFFVVGVHNERSQRALRKIGAVPSHETETQEPDGTVRRNVVFTIESRAWQATASRPDHTYRPAPR